MSDITHLVEKFPNCVYTVGYYQEFIMYNGREKSVVLPVEYVSGNLCLKFTYMYTITAIHIYHEIGASACNCIFKISCQNGCLYS